MDKQITLHLRNEYSYAAFNKLKPLDVNRRDYFLTQFDPQCNNQALTLDNGGTFRPWYWRYKILMLSLGCNVDCTGLETKIKERYWLAFGTAPLVK